MLCGSEKGIRSIIAGKGSGVRARLCLGFLSTSLIPDQSYFGRTNYASIGRVSGRRIVTFFIAAGRRIGESPSKKLPYPAEVSLITTKSGWTYVQSANSLRLYVSDKDRPACRCATRDAKLNGFLCKPQTMQSHWEVGQ